MFASGRDGAAAMSPATRRTARQKTRLGDREEHRTAAVDSLLAADCTAAAGLRSHHSSNSSDSSGSRKVMRAPRQAAAVSAAVVPLSPGLCARTPVRSSSASYTAAAARLGSYTPVDKRAKEVRCT